jgi:hypothetical protein
VSLDKASAIAIMAGSVLFLVAAFSPISRIFGIRDGAEKLAIITAAPHQWAAAQLLFGLGALVTVVGVGLLAYRLAGQGPSLHLYASVALMTIGALLWSWHLYLRTVDPAVFTAGGVPAWLFIGYSILTILGLALIGTALLQTGLAPWVGWLAIGSAAAFLVLGLVFGDLPPLLYYLVTLTVGTMLYRAASAGIALIATG